MESDTVAAAGGEGGEADSVPGELFRGVRLVDGLEAESVGADDWGGAGVAVGGFVLAHAGNDLRFDPGAILAVVLGEAVDPGEGANGEVVVERLVGCAGA